MQQSAPLVLVTGAHGQLGQELQRLAPHWPQFRFHFADADTLDIAQRAAVMDFFQQNQPQYCLNCAAYTAVDRAEQEPAQAFLANAQGPINLALACQQRGALLLHLSTDFVFGGQASRPLRESATAKPLGVYGASKLAGERAARKHCSRTWIVRTAWLYSSFGNNFPKTMLRLAQQRPELRVVADQVGTPTYARDLAQALLAMLDHARLNPGRQEALSGIYHYSNEGAATWYDFAHATLQLAGIHVPVRPIASEEYPTPAKRPAFSVLDKRKIKRTFQLEIPHWRDSLAQFIHEIRQA